MQKAIVIGFLYLLTALRFYFKLKFHALWSGKAFRYEPLWLVLIRYALGIVLMSSLVLYLVADPAPVDWRFAMPGSLIALCAIALLFATHRALDGNFSTTIDVGKERSLVTTGPYRLVRHPMYVAYLMFFLGLLAVSKNLAFGLSGAAIILSLMVIRIRYEEASLLERFGEEYARYAESVPRFFPRMKGEEK